MTALLLSHRGNPNQRNHVFGRTALHYAVDYDYIEIVKLLLKF